jgi:hypothetical protein
MTFFRLLDHVLSASPGYRKWRGGEWRESLVPDYSGWSAGITLWSRRDDARVEEPLNPRTEPAAEVLAVHPYGDELVVEITLEAR